MGARPVALPFRPRAPSLSFLPATFRPEGLVPKFARVTSASVTAVTTIAVVRLPAPNRLKLLLLVSGMLLLVLPSSLCAQEDSGDIPLGDLARSLRRKPDPSEVVVDNDNLSKVVDDAETRRAAGSAPVFSLAVRSSF